MSKYAPLARHLESLSANSVRLTFRDIESIIGSSLPKSARDHRAWWTNSHTDGSHNWAYLWFKAGWKVHHVNRDGRWVDFHRINEKNNVHEIEHFGINSPKAREGYELDRVILSKARNPALAKESKQRDGFTCQACGFKLRVDATWVIEVHHLNPLAITGETETLLEDLISLCPTCHRVAHLRNPPYKVHEIRELRQMNHDVAKRVCEKWSCGGRADDSTSPGCAASAIRPT